MAEHGRRQSVSRRDTLYHAPARNVRTGTVSLYKRLKIPHCDPRTTVCQLQLLADATWVSNATARHTSGSWSVVGPSARTSVMGGPVTRRSDSSRLWSAVCSAPK